VVWSHSTTGLKGAVQEIAVLCLMLRPHLAPFGAWVKANPCRRITMTFSKEGHLLLQQLDADEKGVSSG
jgi:hypothetical protein